MTGRKMFTGKPEDESFKVSIIHDEGEDAALGRLVSRKELNISLITWQATLFIHIPGPGKGAWLRRSQKSPADHATSYTAWRSPTQPCWSVYNQ